MGVQINGSEGNVIATKGTYSGNVTIGGTLTYEDVTNIDSVGLVTARNGIEIGARPGVAASISVDGNMIVSGISTFGGASKFGGNMQMTSANPEFEFNDGGPRFRVPASNTLSVFTSGGLGSTSDERLRLDSSGRLLLGTITEGQADADNLTIADSGSCGITIRSGTSAAGAIYFSDATSGAAEYDGAVIYNQSSQYMDFYTAQSQRLRIESGGRLLVNGTSSTSPEGFDHLIQVNAANHEGGITIGRHTANANGPALIFQKSRSGTATPGSGVVSSGDVLGTIRFYGSDGTDRNSFAANIGCEVDGTPGSNDMPGRLIFSTTADGSATSTERMRISKDGHVTKPTQFHIVVSRSGNQTGYNPSQGFGTGILYNSVVTTQGTDSSILDSSTGRITVPVAGIYFLEGSGYSSTAAFTQGWFTKNGSRLAYSDFMNNSGASQNFNSNGFHKLAANDTIGFKAYGSAHTSVTVEASIYHTWMRITLVG